MPCSPRRISAMRRRDTCQHRLACSAGLLGWLEARRHFHASAIETWTVQDSAVNRDCLRDCSNQSVLHS